MGEMTLEEIRRRRAAMGRGTLGWVTSSDMVGEIDERRWLLLSGAPSPDMNMLLMQVDDGQLLEESLAQIEERDLQPLVMLADEGKALADRVPKAFAHVGQMPIMSKPLDGEPADRDPRVRRATAADRDVATELIVQAYGMTREVAQYATAPLLHDNGDRMSLWLMEDRGEAVSTVTVARDGDVAALWSMATPPSQQRKGYGRALLATVLGQAQRDGARLGVLGATPAGYPLYEATGWLTYETFELFVGGESEQFS
jgi:GNAT superfamily N-acetyltransferase